MAGAAMDSDAEAFEGLGQAYGEEIFEDAEQVQLGSTSEREQDPPYENPGVDAGQGDGRQPGPGVQATPRVARVDDLSPGNSELSRMEKGAPVPSWAGAVTQAMQEEPELVPAEPGRSLIGAGGLGGNVGAPGVTHPFPVASPEVLGTMINPLNLAQTQPTQALRTKSFSLGLYCSSAEATHTTPQEGDGSPLPLGGRAGTC